MHLSMWSTSILKGAVTVGIRPTLPVGGISLILGNDLVGSKMMPDLHVLDDPNPQLVVDKPDRIFPVCTVTRAAARRARVEQEQDDQRVSTNNVNNESSLASGVANSLEDHLTDKYLSLTR